MKAKFRNKNGDLSIYSFCCGYVQRKEKNNMRKVLFMEHSMFHVKKYKVANGELELFEWNTYGLLTPARKDFNRNK
jgi:hypothetical protein